MAYTNTVYGTYLGHSGFLIETADATLIFDWGYAKDVLGKQIADEKLPEIRSDKPLYVFVSHIHADHFRPENYDLLEKYPVSEMYLGYDHSILEVDEQIERLSDTVKNKISFFDGEQKLIVNDHGNNMTISTLRSTDLGVAYLVDIDGIKLFHAGDLFLMQTMKKELFYSIPPEMISREWGRTFKSYEDYLDYCENEFIEFTTPLKGMDIDYGMLPLDPRFDGIGVRTVERYFEIANIKLWTPMHMWGNYGFVEEFAQRYPIYAKNMLGTANRNVYRQISVGEKYIIIEGSNEKIDADKSSISDKKESTYDVPTLDNKTGAKDAPSKTSKASDNGETDEGWGPQRDYYHWGKTVDRIVFNSFIDNPNVGDERQFVRIRKCSGGENYGDSIKLEVGEEYEVRVFFHNNAHPDLNDEGKGVATNVRLMVEAPEVIKKGTTGIIKGIIHSAEGEAKDIWDTVSVYADSTVLLRYVANSAIIHSNGSVDGTVLVSKAMFGNNGVYLAYSDSHWGVLPGGEEYAGYVTFRFKVDQAGFRITTSVRVEGQSEFQKKVTAKPGDILEIRIMYENTGTINQKSIIFYDTLPSGLEYQMGSSYYKSNFSENYVSDRLFTGINLGDYRPGDWAILTYKAKIVDDPVIFPSGSTLVKNNASIATANGTGRMSVQINVQR